MIRGVVMGSLAARSWRQMPAGVRADLLAMLRSGATWTQVQAEFECSHHMVWIVVRDAGGMAPVWPARSSKHLSLEDREEMYRGLCLAGSRSR